jgi:monoamine oxidase
MKKDRREFLKLSSLAAFGAAALPFSPSVNRLLLPPPEELLDVIIIGGGIAGLTAAYRLEQLGISDILIVEARNEVGGRTLNIPVSGGYVAEGGGQWIGGSQTAIMDLLEELGIDSFPSFLDGEAVGEGTLGSNAQAAFDNAVTEINSLADTIPLDSPWDAPDALALDNTSLNGWLISTAGNINAYLELYGSVVAFLGEAQSISLLYFLYYVKSAGSFEALSTDAQESRISGGAQALSLALKAIINSPISLNNPVVSIDDQGQQIEVVTNDATYCAKKIIIAMSPSDANNIDFISDLPENRVSLQNNWVMESGAKISLVYDTPFWRELGYNGTAYGNALFFTSDNSPEDGSTGILVGFPNNGFLNQNQADREQIAKNEVESFFGPEAQNNIDYTETNWTDEPFIAGCTSPIPQGVLTSVGTALAEPAGNIHWAGTESSSIWTGYMDGAVRSGQRSAMEVRTIILSESNRQQPEFLVYPNPAKDFAQISFQQEASGDLVLFDSKGNRAMHLTIKNQKSVRLDLNSISNGNYLIVLSEKNLVLRSHKLIIAK